MRRVSPFQGRAGAYVVKQNASTRWPYWNDPTWRLFRTSQMVICAILLTLLVLYLAGVASVLYPLAAAVILNIVAATVVVARGIQLRIKSGPSR